MDERDLVGEAVGDGVEGVPGAESASPGAILDDILELGDVVRGVDVIGVIAQVAGPVGLVRGGFVGFGRCGITTCRLRMLRTSSRTASYPFWSSPSAWWTSVDSGGRDGQMEDADLRATADSQRDIQKENTVWRRLSTALRPTKQNDGRMAAVVASFLLVALQLVGTRDGGVQPLRWHHGSRPTFLRRRQYLPRLLP